MAYLQALRQAKILWVMIILAGILAVLPMVSAWNSNILNNSMPSRNITFPANSNITEYFYIPTSTSYITRAVINIMLPNSTSNITNPWIDVGNTRVWSVNETLYNNGTLQNHGLAMATLISSTINTGMNFSGNFGASSTGVIYGITKDSNVNATKCLLLNESLANQSVGDFIGDYCAFTQNRTIANATNYYVFVNRGGLYYTYVYGNLGSFPVTTGAITWKWGYGGGADGHPHSITGINLSNGSILTPTQIDVKNALNNYNINNCSGAGNCNVSFMFHSNLAGALEYYNINISNEGFSENYVNYSSSVIEGETTQINASFSIDIVPDSIILYYNNTAYTPNILTNGTTYFLSSWVIAPQVNENKNVNFYFTYSKSGNMSNSSLYNQTINNIGISPDCGAGTFLFLNISNYDEEILNLINGTVEWNLNLINSGFIIASSNGTATGYNISLCSSKNLSSSTSTYSLALRYYIINNSYFYKTYNIQANPGAGTPISIPLYYLNNSKGTQFNINYVNFNYFNHPGAIIQIQREYLAEGIYRVVEIPQINDDGLTVGSFNTNKIKYKLIVMNNGVILDIFDNIFPVCQNIILGTCNINLRGAESVTTTTEEDLIYTLTKSNTSITLTFVIPSGAPKNINFVAQQNSRFLTDISSYNSSLYASGGTFIYNYNNTIGDSIINTQINVNNQPSLYGSIIIAEDLSGFYILNNFFIAFVLLLALGLMFISSGVMIVIMAVLGLFYLSLIFLLRGADIVTISSSMIFFIIGSIIIIYKISKKEEKT